MRRKSHCTERYWQAERLAQQGFNRDKCEVLHLVWNSPKQQYRLGSDWLECSAAEKDLGVSVDSKLDMTQQCSFAAMKAESLLGCSTTRRSRDVIISCYLALHRPQLEYCVKF